MPKGRKKLTVDTDEANEVVERNRSFNISHTGTFVLPNEGVRINAQGMKVIEGKEYAETRAKTLMTNFADFDVLEHVGHGGGGVVNKALHVPTNETVAVKRINVLDADKRHQLVRELKTLWKASSPYIVDFKGAFFDEDHLYVVLEYMDGGSLQDVLRKAGKIPEAIIGQMTQSIVHGLAYLKQLKMVHRDIKPGNILISRQGQVKLTDFGVTGDLSAAAAEASTFVGTAKYMSPEQLRGKSYAYPADVWALGICLMELATGEHPYSKYKCASQMELLLALENEPLPELPASMFTPDFCDFTRRCLTMEPDDRATVEALLEMPFVRLSGGQDVSAWFSQLDLHKAKKGSPSQLVPPRRNGLSVPRSFTTISPSPSPQHRNSGAPPSPQAAAARELALSGMSPHAAARILASPGGSMRPAAAAVGVRAGSRERIGTDGHRSGSREGRPPLPQNGAGARPARRITPMKAARARTPDNGGAGFSRAGYGNGHAVEFPALATPPPASALAASASVNDPGHLGDASNTSPYRPRSLHHHVNESPLSSPADEGAPHYDGSRAGGYRSRLAAWRRQQNSSTVAMAYGSTGGSGSLPLHSASPVGLNVAAADVAAAEAWAVLRQQEDADGRPYSGGNAIGCTGTPQQQLDNAGRLSPGSFAAAAKAYAGRSSPAAAGAGFGLPTGSRSGRDALELQKELAHVTTELASLESSGGMASGGRGNSGAGGSSGGGGDRRTATGGSSAGMRQPSPSGTTLPTDLDEQQEMLRMLQPLQKMVRRLEQDTRTGR